MFLHKVAIATFTTYAFIHHDSSDIEDRLTPQKAFVALSLFELIRFPLAMMPMMIQLLVQVGHFLMKDISLIKGIYSFNFLFNLT